MKKSMLIRIRSLLPGVLIAVGPLPGTLAADLHVPSDYATIQAAVDAAASGDTIRIAPGDYYEQIVIADKNDLTLAGEPGEPGSVLRAFSGMTPRGPSAGLTNSSPASNVVSILLTVRSQVVLTNLTLDGAGLGDLYAPDWLWGLYSQGSNARIEGCTFKGFRGGAQTQARGITFGNSLVWSQTPVVNLSVLNSRFIDDMRPMVIGGDTAVPTLLSTTFTIEGNTFVGFGPTLTRNHTGLIILMGAGGEVRGNTMTGFSYGGANPGFCAAIQHFDGLYRSRGFSPGQPVRYEGNTFSNNADHLMLFTANDCQVVNNIFHGTGDGGYHWGGLAVSGTNIVVANNDFSGMPNGIVLLGNDIYDGVSVRPASNVSLNDNWFCNVTTPVSIRSGAVAIQDQGTKACEDEPFVGVFRPVFQSIVPLAGGGATLTLRAWHGDTVAIEQSSDLKVGVWWGTTHTMLLPTYQFKDVSKSKPGTPPHRFYRAVLSSPFDPFFGFDAFGGCKAGKG